MGSNIAPAKAQLTLAKAEHSVCVEAAERGLITIANRFMDDVMAAAAYSADDRESEESTRWF